MGKNTFGLMNIKISDEMTPSLLHVERVHSIMNDQIRND